MQKPNVRIWLILGALVVGMLLGGGYTARAGYKSTGRQVVISGSSASGAMGAARSSGDTLQYIGCALVRYTTGPNASYGICHARNAAGTTVACSTTEPAMMDNMRAVNGISLVIFSWDVSGICTEVDVENDSYYPPMVP